MYHSLNGSMWLVIIELTISLFLFASDFYAEFALSEIYQEKSYWFL